MMEKQKQYELVASFSNGNCIFEIKQPIKEASLDDLESFHKALGKLLYD